MLVPHAPSQLEFIEERLRHRHPEGATPLRLGRLRVLWLGVLWLRVLWLGVRRLGVRRLYSLW